MPGDFKEPAPIAQVLGKQPPSMFRPGYRISVHAYETDSDLVYMTDYSTANEEQFKASYNKLRKIKEDGKFARFSTVVVECETWNVRRDTNKWTNGTLDTRMTWVNIGASDFGQIIDAVHREFQQLQIFKSPATKLPPFVEVPVDRNFKLHDAQPLRIDNQWICAPYKDALGVIYEPKLANANMSHRTMTLPPFVYYESCNLPESVKRDWDVHTRMRQPGYFVLQ